MSSGVQKGNLGFTGKFDKAFAAARLMATKMSWSQIRFSSRIG